MIYLLFAIAASTLILVSFRIFSKLGIDDFSAITVNYIIGALFGFSTIGWQFSSFAESPERMVILSVITGILLISGFVFFGLSTRKAGMAITAISSRMSVIIPVMLGILVVGDNAGAMKIAGIILALIAFWLSLKKEGKINISGSAFLIPLGVFILLGLNDSIVKITQHYFLPAGDERAYITYAATSFFVAFIIGTAGSVVRIGNGTGKMNGRSIGAGVILGLLNWASMFFLLKGLEKMQVSVFIPVLNVSVVTLSALTGFLVFREKLRPVNWAGITLALLAIVLIAAG